MTGWSGHPQSARSQCAALCFVCYLLVSQVRSLCGGIIAYYNAGGRVRDLGGTGREVQAVHPGSTELRSLVTRPNNWKPAGDMSRATSVRVSLAGGDLLGQGGDDEGSRDGAVGEHVGAAGGVVGQEGAGSGDVAS